MANKCKHDDDVATEPTFLTGLDAEHASDSDENAKPVKHGALDGKAFREIDTNGNVADLLQQMELLDRQLEDAELICFEEEGSDSQVGAKHNVVDNVQTNQKSRDGGVVRSGGCQEDVEIFSAVTPMRSSNGELPSSLFANEFPTLDFPVTISIDELNTSSTSSILGPEHQNSARGSVAKSSIARNKSLCLVKGQSKKLTPEEEERVAEILMQEDDALENYIVPSEMTRESELDILLSDLGYQFSADDVTQHKTISRGDPVLRELAEKRSLEEREKSIDKALRVLIREPLPQVIRIVQATDLSSIGDSMLSAPISEEQIHQLVQEVKQNLLEDNMSLADQHSVRLLATAILNGEAAKSSLYSESFLD